MLVLDGLFSSHKLFSHPRVWVIADLLGRASSDHGRACSICVRHFAIYRSIDEAADSIPSLLSLIVTGARLRNTISSAARLDAAASRDVYVKTMDLELNPMAFHLRLLCRMKPRITLLLSGYCDTQCDTEHWRSWKTATASFRCERRGPRTRVERGLIRPWIAFSQMLKYRRDHILQPCPPHKRQYSSAKLASPLN